MPEDLSRLASCSRFWLQLVRALLVDGEKAGPYFHDEGQKHFWRKRNLILEERLLPPPFVLNCFEILKRLSLQNYQSDDPSCYLRMSSLREIAEETPSLEELEIKVKWRCLAPENSPITLLLQGRKQLFLAVASRDSSRIFSQDHLQGELKLLQIWRRSSPRTIERPTAAILSRDDRLYISTNMGKIYCLHEELSTLIWESRSRVEIKRLHQGRETLFAILNGNSLAAFSLKTQEETWNLRLEDPISHFLIDEESGILIATAATTLYAFCSHSYALNWKLECQETIKRALLLEDQKIAILVLQNHTLIALHLQSGEVKWQKKVGGELLSQLLYANQMVYFVANCSSPTLYLINTKKGEIHAEAPLDAKRECSLAFGLETKLYIGSDANCLYSYDLKSGLLEEIHGYDCRSSKKPILAVDPSGMLFVGMSHGEIQIFDPKSNRSRSFIQLETKQLDFLGIRAHGGLYARSSSSLCALQVEKKIER